MRILKVAFFTQVLLYGLVCQAGIYKWVDEDGKVHFGDKVPDKQEAKDVESELKKKENIDESGKSFKSAVGAKVGKKTADEELVEKKRLKALEEKIGEYCRKLKKEMNVMANGEPFVFHDAEGNEQTVLERDRDEKLQEWRERYGETGCEELDPLE